MGVGEILTEGWNRRGGSFFQKFQTYYPKNVLQSYITKKVVWLHILS